MCTSLTLKRTLAPGALETMGLTNARAGAINARHDVMTEADTMLYYSTRIEVSNRRALGERGLMRKNASQEF